MLLLLLMVNMVYSVMWLKENIAANAQIKKCLHEEHANLITLLFPSDTLEYEEREAIALDYLARLLKTGGMRFCEALDVVLTSTTQQLKRRSDANTSWQSTFDRYQQNCRESLTQCAARQIEEYTGVRSECIKCIDKTMRDTAYALIRAQFFDEERHAFNQ